MNEQLYTRTFHVRWGDMDFNSHMRNTAYLDVSADVRMMFFRDHGFPMSEFERLRIGPVILKDELEYFREMRLLDEVTVTLVLAGMSADGSRFLLRNEFFRSDGKPVAKVTSSGGWLSQAERKLCAPPDSLLAAMNLLQKSADFKELDR